MLLGLCGLVASGKDSVGTILVEQYGFVKLSFAEPVYESVWEINPWICVNYTQPTFVKLQDLVNDIGWDRAKRTYPDVRRYLKVIGYEVGRNIIGVESWIRLLEANRSTLPKNTAVVITDVRFVNEEWYLHSHGGSLWRIARPQTGLADSHISELGQKDLQADYTLHNNGDLASLHVKVADALERERNK